MFSTSNPIREQHSYLASIAPKLTNIRNIVSRCCKIGFSIFEGVAAGHYPLAASTAFSAHLKIQDWCLRQILPSGHTEFGFRKGNTLMVGNGGIFNSALFHEIEKQKKEIGLSARNDIEYLFVRAPWDSPSMITSSSTTFDDTKYISCHPILFYNDKYIDGYLEMNSTQAIPEIKELRAGKVYREFLRTHALLSISENHALRRGSAGLLTQMALVMLLHYFKRKGSWAYVLIAGLSCKFLADMTKALYNRSQIYQSDKKAVEVTKDPGSAAACLKLLEKIAVAQKSSFSDRLLWPLMVLFTDSGKEEFFEPSFEKRIQNLGSPTPVSEPFSQKPPQPTDLEEQVRAYKELPEVKLFLAAQKSLHAVQDGILLAKNIASHWKLAPKKLLSWLVLSKILDARVASLVSLFNLYYIFYPHHFNFAATMRGQNSVTLASDELQEKVKRVAHEMSIKKPILVWHHADASVPFHCKGIGHGPGAAEIMTVPTPDKSIEAFVLRHELAHLLHGDLLKVPAAYYGASMLASACLKMTIGSPKTLLGSLAQGAIIDGIASAIFYAYSQYIEQQADLTAIDDPLNKDELIRGGIQFFEKGQQANIKAKDENVLNRLMISASGENRLDFAHPSFASRIQTLQQHQ